ncbi:MAG: ASCH domain-containing protein [Candidatus Woesearchaeota archaeon]|jgi:hypothetical protein
MKKILNLTLLRKWFDEIASGRKTEEYREIKPYWTTRLEGKEYDVIYFKNGYNKDAPFMIVEFKGLKKTKRNNKIEYAILLGKILDLKNYP